MAAMLCHAEAMEGRGHFHPSTLLPTSLRPPVSPFSSPDGRREAAESTVRPTWTALTDPADGQSWPW
jgi:hypothetical protein